MRNALSFSKPQSETGNRPEGWESEGQITKVPDTYHLVPSSATLGAIPFPHPALHYRVAMT